MSPALPEQRLRAKRPDRFAKSGAGQKTPGHLRGRTGGVAGASGERRAIENSLPTRQHGVHLVALAALASGCAACAVDQPRLRHIHSRVSATISFFAEADVGARPGTEPFFECVHPCCDK